MPALTTARGPLSTAEQLLGFTLASCTEFQSMTGTADAASALAKSIYFGSTPKSENLYAPEKLIAMRPFAVLRIHPLMKGLRFKKVAGPFGAECWADSGLMYLMFEQNAENLLVTGETLQSVGDDELERRWNNQLGAIFVRESSDPDGFVAFSDLAGQGGYLDAVDMEIDKHFRIAEEDVEANGDFMFTRFIIRWGAN